MEYLVKQSTLEGEHDFGDSKMNRFELVLEADGQTFQAQHWLKTNIEGPVAGDRVDTELVQARGRDGGLKTKGLQVLNPQAAGTPAAATPAPSGPAPARAATSGSPRDRSIERQVALKAAVELGSAAIAAGKKVPAEVITATAEKFAAFINPPPAVVQAPLPAATDLPTDAPPAGAPVPAAADSDIPF